MRGQEAVAFRVAEGKRVTLVDRKLLPRWIPFLRDAGWKATHWSTIGKASASGSEIMKFAAANDYVVLKNDLDFASVLAASHQKKPSVAQIRRPGPEPECDRQTNHCGAPARSSRVGSGSSVDQ